MFSKYSASVLKAFLMSVLSFMLLQQSSFASGDEPGLDYLWKHMGQTGRFFSDPPSNPTSNIPSSSSSSSTDTMTISNPWWAGTRVYPGPSPEELARRNAADDAARARRNEAILKAEKQRKAEENLRIYNELERQMQFEFDMFESQGMREIEAERAAYEKEYREKQDADFAEEIRRIETEGDKRIKKSLRGLEEICFPGDTLVSLKDASAQGYHSQPISSVRVGDQVLSCNLSLDSEGTGACEVGEVQALIKNQVDHLRKLTLGEKVIRATDRHPFYVVNQRKWIAAQDLIPGDQFLTISGETITLDENEIDEGDFTVYNLDVRGNHNYYAYDVLVHNCKSLGIPVPVIPELAGFQAPQAEAMALAAGAVRVVHAEAMAVAAGEAAALMTPAGAALAAGLVGVYLGEQIYDHFNPPPTTLPQESLGTGNGTEFLPGQAGEASSSSTTTPAMAPQAGDNNTFASGKEDDSAGQNVKGNIEKISDKQLEKLGIDAHELKKDFLGKKAKISEYDIYKNKDTGELEILKKGGKGEGIPTGERFKDR